MSRDNDYTDWSQEDGLMNRDVMLTNNPDSYMQFGRSMSLESSADRLDQDENAYQYNDYDSSGQHSEEESSNSSSSTTSDKNYKVMTFKNGTDVSAIPIQKDGMAVCQKCGAIGVKHAFYSKSKRFCSLACSRSYLMMEREGKPIPKPQPVFKFPLAKVKIFKKDDPAKEWPMNLPSKHPPRDLSNSYTWESLLVVDNFSGAPVSSFKHAPLNECWDNIMVGMKVEVENRDFDDLKELFPHSYWVASVIKVAGYKALLRFEGFGMDDREDFWLNMCKKHIQPVGWCASQGKPLIPPKSIQHKYQDWKEFLVKRLTGARTIPGDFHEKVEESLTSKFIPGMHLEVVDKNRISSMGVAYVEEVVGGRLHVKYHGSDPNDTEGFWCHEKSPLIHPIGWAQSVGHNITISAEYARIALQKAISKTYNENEASWELFGHQGKGLQTHLKFKEGMKLEAIDPLNLSAICVATVTKVLKNNYLMIGIDGYNEKGTDWFCHHATSASIFPAGFCELNHIDITPPRGYRGTFKWFDYLKSTMSIAAPVALFNRELPNHGFKINMRLEAVDLMEPRLICVGTITKVIGRLLRVHFDGWDVNYDQWCDCESPDLYPVGWCELVGYHLEGPRDNGQGYEKKRKNKTPPYRGPRKKKRTRLFGAFGRPKSIDKLGFPGEEVKQNNEKFSAPPNIAEQSFKGISQKQDNDDNALSIEDCFQLDIQGSPVRENEGELINVIDDSPVLPTPKTIPRLVDSGGGGPTMTSHQTVITPELWSIFDVSQFLRINDCGTYCESFTRKRIDGRKFLTLTKEQIVNLTGMKVGPSLKIFDLIQQLKAKVQNF